MNPRDEVHEFRTAVDRQINSTLVVGTASAGQNLQFGSGGFSWVTPASVSFDDLAPSGSGSPGMLTTDGATWSYVSYATARTSLGLVIGTDVQAYSAKLAALAALTWASDKGVYLTGTSTLATFDLPSFGRSLCAATTKAAAKTAMGLEIGTDVQAYSAKLDALAVLTWANDKSFLQTGTGTLTTYTVTTAARTVLDDTTVAAMVDTLGGASSTGTGGLVRATSPTLVTPALGTPTALVLTSATGLVTAGINANQVTNAKLAQMATSTFKGRNSGGTGDPEDMTVAQVLAKLGCPYVLASEAGNPVRTIGVSSTAEQTLCSLTVPAGTLGTAGKCVLELVGDITNNSGGANSYQLKVKFGATTAYDKTSSFSTGTQPRPLVIRVHLCALGATNAQRLTTELYHGYLLTATVGNGDWGDFNGRAFTMQGTAAEDSTAAKALAVTVQNSVSNANINWRLYSAKLVCTP